MKLFEPTKNSAILLVQRHNHTMVAQPIMKDKDAPRKNVRWDSVIIPDFRFRQCQRQLHSASISRNQKTVNALTVLVPCNRNILQAAARK